MATILTRAASDRALLLYLDEEQVPRTTHALSTAPLPGVVNLHPAYRSLLVVFDPLLWDHASLERSIAARLEAAAERTERQPRTVEIPARYDGEDLDAVAAHHGMSTGRVIELHSGATYTVRFFGFLPGFAYLGGLPPELHTPRLATPRSRVPAGSVAIGGAQTAVYPFDSPGGWRIIGHTNLCMFRSESPHTPVEIGDRIRFVPWQS